MGFSKDRHRRGASRGLFGQLGRFVRDRRGNVAAITALLIVPLAGVLGLATEASSWLLIDRAEQNAADSAAVAAATNGGNGGTTYAIEGQSVASSYGFTNGANNTTVLVTAPNSPVPPCAGSTCYTVTITKNVPLYLLRAVGYNGNVALASGRGQSVQAVAVATTTLVDSPQCLLALGKTASPFKNGYSIDGSGLAHSTITCNVMSDGQSAYCNGSNGLTTGFSDSVGSQQDSNHSCGSHETGVLTTLADPYQATLANNPPTNPCSSYVQETVVKKKLSAPTMLSGTPGWDGTEKVLCGDVALSGPVTFSGASTVLVIENGQLDLNGFTLSTASGAGLTIVFTSPTPSSETYTAGGTPGNFIADNGGGGVLDIAAPTSGTWSGLAVVQNQNLPVGNVTYTGNSPTFDITGVLDAPVTNLTAKGAVNKSTNGFSCFTLVINSLVIKGTGDLFYANAQSQCAQAGVTTIEEPSAFIGQLVY